MTDWRRRLLLTTGLLLALCTNPLEGIAHTLGIDKADLYERGDGEYELVSRVPPRIAPAITAPELPGHCELTGNPRGERGAYSVRYQFRCESALTADHILVLPWQREGVMLTTHWEGAEPVTRFSGKSGGTITIHLYEYLAGSGSLAAAAKRYTLLGIEHILEGIDHLLFVLALLLIVQGGWRLVKTITAFTVAHSITLGLATLGFIRLPSAPVESAIALSIVFLCAEICYAQQGKISITYRYPWIVAFAFGLLHGLGFAGALSEIGLPPAEIPVALLFFNIGVELGQLLFIGALMLLLYAGRKLIGGMNWDRVAPAGRIFAAYVFGTMATVWFVERVGPVFGLA